MKQILNKYHMSIFCLLLLITNDKINARQTITNEQLWQKTHDMWLGQMIGNMAGRGTEGKYNVNPGPEIPWIITDTVIKGHNNWVIKQVWDGDDDTDIEYMNIHILEEYGFDCTGEQIASQWLAHSDSAGIYIANEQAWGLMGEHYYPPQTGSRWYNEHWYAIDSQITTEVFGALSPGMTQQAIDLAGKFAHVTNEGFPVHASQFYAAMYSQAYFESDIETIVNNALKVVPTTSRTYEVISDIINRYNQDREDGSLDWVSTRQQLYDHYAGAYDNGRYYNWVESTVNVGATTLALLYGQGDFKKTVRIAVLAGWDNDCNPATAAGIIAIISGIPSDLTDPEICGDTYKNVYRMGLPDPNADRPQYDSITSIANRIVVLTQANILAHGGSETDGVWTIPEEKALNIDPEKPDPNSPGGLVGLALANNVAVDVTAAVEKNDHSDDRYDLDGIINGITDNSYNGHRPYCTYLSNPSERPTDDWYQLNFSLPVRFDSLTFYEGDIHWGGINTYYRNDETNGGFFEDLTVEVLRDGHYYVPAGLQMSEPLDRYKMYQEIEFTFSPTVGQAIRVRGQAGGAKQFTTIMELEATGQLDPGLYIDHVLFTGDSPQRSWIDSVGIVFSSDVNVLKQDIAVVGVLNGTTFSDEQVSFSYDGGGCTAELRFDLDHDGLFNDSLPDDQYELRLNCGSITDKVSGQQLLDSDAQVGDGLYVIGFHRLYGDNDGSGNIDLVDLAGFVSAWLAGGDIVPFDNDGDGKIDLKDWSYLADNWQDTIDQ